MCIGFGVIVTKNLDLFFCEPDVDGNCSHTEILKRLEWDDNNNLFLRSFVRIECADWIIQSFAFDEMSSLPTWVENARDEIHNMVEKTLLACAPAWAEYEKVRAPARAEYKKVRDMALAEYEKACNMARAEYEKACNMALAEYEKACNMARAEYEKVRTPAQTEYEKMCVTAWAEYAKVCVTAWAEYEKACNMARAEYEKACNMAWAEYEKVRDMAQELMITRLSTIKGYIGEKL